MATVTTTLSDLVDRVTFDLMAPGELGMLVQLDGAINDTVTTVTLDSGTGVKRSDTLEVEDELMLVSAVSTNDLTVSRGFYRSTAASHADNTVGYVNPPFPRVRIAEAIKRSFSRMEALGIPLVKTGTYNRTTDLSYVEMGDDVREVYRVMYWGTDGRLYELDGWEFYPDVPTGVVTDGTFLNVPTYVANADDLEIVYRAPYRWSTDPVTFASTIEIPEGAEDLPPLYAAAWLSSSREVSRSELDRSQEWGNTEQFYRGQSAAIVRAKWQEFYRAVDEARRLNHIPQPIHWKPRPKLL